MKMFQVTTLSKKKIWLVKEVIFHKLHVSNASDEKELSFLACIWPLLCSSATLKKTAFSWKERILCFATDLFISSHFSGSEAVVSNQSAISLCFPAASAGEILNSLCRKLFLNFILVRFQWDLLGMYPKA